MKLEEQRIALLKVMGFEETEPWLNGTRCFENRQKTVGYEYDSLPYYFDSLDDLYLVEENVGLHNRENTELRVKWINTLRDIVGRDCPKNKSGSSLVTDVDLMTAPAEKRAEALLKTLKLWRV